MGVGRARPRQEARHGELFRKRNAFPRRLPNTHAITVTHRRIEPQRRGVAKKTSDATLRFARAASAEEGMEASLLFIAITLPSLWPVA
ncbi:hypothetical protein AGOR_G00164550 [Albula goreensis]|uniref:Uncharacterized protein n=1 Tax=Albula goreensis TaxID=1534307 RepID=A0A8T3CZG6_9TELE|nr:hypothetical protein AGOR_G00164550 [Albula goreensis]